MGASTKGTGVGESHYQVLGVTPEAEDVVIEGAYKALLKRYHPDVHQGDTATATARTARINAAYSVLRDKDARARYDRDQGFSAAPPPPRGARQDHAQSPSPPPPRRAEAWSPPAAAPPPIPPASGRAKAISAAFVSLAVLVLIAGVGSFGKNGGAEAGASPPPSAEAPSSTPAPVPSAPVRAEAEAEAKQPTPTTYDPSFDCSKADSAVLTTICTSPELSKADREMAARYKELLATADPPDQLRAAQRQWLAERDASAADVDTLQRLYQDRLLALGSDGAIADQLY